MNTNPVQIDIGTSGSIQVTGDREIVITESKAEKAGRCSTYNLFYYKGRFRSGTNQGFWIEASVFAYHSEDAITLHNRCTSFHHPYVMRSLGYGRGVGAYSDYTFVALPSFRETLGEWVVEASGAVEMGRFTEQFIDIVSQTVKGMKALHDHGFHCPSLRPKHIAVKLENGCFIAQIWNFQPFNSDMGEPKGWRGLASLLLEAARNNGAGGDESIEIDDLCTKMRSGELKGLDILKHSALLTVQQKFDNVIALNLHVLLNCKAQPKESSTELAETQSSANLAPSESSTVSTETYTLDEYLDKLHTETSSRPHFMYLKRTGNTPNTFRKLLDEIRDVVEHENEYIPPELTKRFTPEEMLDGGQAIDLEQHLRAAWPKSFLKMQLWAHDPDAKLQK